MHNFQTHFWRKFQDFKEKPALLELKEGEKPQLHTFWEWTRRVQRLAIALLEAGLEPGQRVAMMAESGRDWLDLSFATWLIGGCVVIVPPDEPRKAALRALARTGSEWIVVQNAAQRSFLEGEAGNLPATLRWIFFEEKGLSEAGFSGASQSSKSVYTIDHLDAQGRSLAVRGWVDKLARAIYAVDSDEAALILFEAPLGEDPHGAFFSGKKLAEMLEFIGEDLQLDNPELKEGACVVSGVDFGYFAGFLIVAATLLRGEKVGVAAVKDEFSRDVQQFGATHLVCSAEFLRGRVENLGQNAAPRLFQDPITREFGRHLRAIYVLDGRISASIREAFEKSEIELLGLLALPESGISHLERASAPRPGSVGRPVQSFACKIKGARREGSGEILLRSHLLFDGYWDENGPRRMDEDGWLHTGRQGRIESGFLYLE